LVAELLRVVARADDGDGGLVVVVHGLDLDVLKLTTEARRTRRRMGHGPSWIERIATDQTAADQNSNFIRDNPLHPRSILLRAFRGSVMIWIGGGVIGVWRRLLQGVKVRRGFTGRGGGRCLGRLAGRRATRATSLCCT